MSDTRGILEWTGRCLVVTLLSVIIGCADDYGRRDSTSGTASSTMEQPTDKISQPTTAQVQDDARFVATEEQGSKIWKASGPGTSASNSNMVALNIKNRGSKPLTLKAVNMLSTEHGFAIDSMKVKEVLKPGEEKTIFVPLANIDPSITNHSVYCQLHPKHVGGATLVVMKDQASATEPAASPSAQGTAGDTTRPPQAIDPMQRKATGGPGASVPNTSTQAGEVSSQVTGESEGQRLIREQSQKQREIDSTSQGEQGPGSSEPKACADFPGFDRGCPGGSR